MFLLALLTIWLMTVPLLGGRLARLSAIRFRRSWAGVVAIVLQYTILRAFPESDAGLLAGLHLASYGLMFYFLAANLSLPGLWLIGLGGACNAAAIAANDGVMPALPSALATAGVVQAPGEFANSTAVADSKLWLLGDVFALPAGWPMANVFSVGDILLLMGAFVLLHRASGSALAPYMARMAAWADRSGPRMELIRRHRTFRRLWVAQGISSIGDWVYPLAVFTAVVEDGGAKASSLAFLLIAHVGPGMVVGIFGGPLIDRFPRKAMMFWTDVVRGLAVATLLLAGEPALGHLYAVALVLGVGTALNQPAFQASLPNILPARNLASANALVGLTMSSAIVIGPLLGALVVTQMGIAWGFTANALSFLYSAGLVYGTKMPAHAPAATASLVRELRVGFRYVATHREILAIVVVVGIVALGAGIKQPLEPLFALQDLDSGSSGYGLLQVAWGLGMVGGAMAASTLDRRLGHGPLLTAGVAVVGLVVLAAAASPALAPVIALWLAAGVANTLGTVAYETLLQEKTPDAVRGRVFAAVEASLQAGLLAGVAATALLGDALPVRSGVAISGLLFLIAAIASWSLLQRRRRGLAARPLTVCTLDLLPAGPSMSLLRVQTEGDRGRGPVLLVDDGRHVHRVEPLPGSGAVLGYGVPRKLLAERRPAFALETGGGLLDITVPRA